MYRELKSPLSVQLELTSECNHSCIHCYNSWREKSLQSNQTLNKGKIKVIIENLKRSEVPSLLITGGEPMLFPSLMFETFDLCKKAEIKCSLNSNLTLVTEDIAKELKRFNINVLTSILSWDKKIHDGITKSKGSFDRLINGIRILHKHGVSVGTNMVVMQSNVDHIYKTGKFVYSIGIKSFRATKVHPSQTTTNYEDIKLPSEKINYIFDELIRLETDFGLKVDSLTTYPICLLKNLNKYGNFLLKRGCSAGKTGCTIGANGQIRPCGHSDDNYGNLIEESLLTIWPRLNSWRDGSLLPTECKECKYIIECTGGCRMDCKFYGDIKSMDPYATGKDFKLIPQTPKKIKTISLKTKLNINPALYFRKEKFGFVLIVDGTFKSIVTADTEKLLRELGNRVFTLNYLLSKYNLKKNVTQNFFSRLLKQNVICMAENNFS